MARRYAVTITAGQEFQGEFDHMPTVDDLCAWYRDIADDVEFTQLIDTQTGETFVWVDGDGWERESALLRRQAE